MGKAIGTSQPHPTPSPEAMALRPKDAAQLLSIGQRKLWELTNADKIPHARVGRAVLYPRAMLLQWLEDQARGVQR